MAKFFISYRHSDGDWVRDRLIGVLEAGGVDYIIDDERMRAGDLVIAQCDAMQDGVDKTIAVLSPEYLVSKYCQHELNRAAPGSVIPILLDDCPIPATVNGTLYVDMSARQGSDRWGLLLDTLEAPRWRMAIDRVVRHLQRGASVNLLADDSALWRPLLDRVRKQVRVGEVDFESGRATDQKGFVNLLLEAAGISNRVDGSQNDLAELARHLLALEPQAICAILHFDYVARRESAYSKDLFSTLRHLIENDKLTLFAHSHAPFGTLVPKDHLLSGVDLKTVDLRRRP